MSQQNRILKHCQRIAQTLGLTENTKGDVHKAGAILLDIIKDLDTLREIRRVVDEANGMTTLTSLGRQKKIEREVQDILNK